MRAILLALLTLAGCASNEYSAVPEPTGEWVPANPPALAAPALPLNAALVLRGVP